MLKSAADMKRLSSKAHQLTLRVGEEINTIGRAIHSAAHSGKTSLEYKVENSDPTFVDRILEELKNSGYAVTRTNNKLAITWA